MLTRAATLKFPLRLLQPPKASSCTPRCSDSNELMQCSAIEANNQVLEKRKEKVRNSQDIENTIKKETEGASKLRKGRN